ncbi:response regulator transcription factor [Ancylomarina salipaludis]|uniref:Response regulator transcription factor n=1 Tax=Ancylomarina salipaludis TaxID=2501299 RepID=A0A4Q1JKH8_9BACT|nr:LytTR family DNA-binding domain-containing protein [Ancylomarina salipaludis]RXQ92258.1 response regulator transcription factor [Ancylomarina salipaludis]
MKCIAVDDEPFALDLIESYIKKSPFLKFHGGFSNPLKALSFLMSNPVDLVFLDINMPELSGLQLLNSLKHKPQVVFTTAYSEYGAQSYEYDAIDYLLKPIKYERFLKAVNKAYDLSGKSRGEGMVVDATPVCKIAIHIKSGSQMYRLQPEDILFVEGAGNYMTFYTKEKKVLSLRTMKETLQQLPSDMFVRVHKSYVVSLMHIDVIERHQLVVKGNKIPIGITYREQFFAKYKMSL